MEGSYPGSSQKPPRHDDHKNPCVDCDLDDFDNLNCEVEGIAAQSDYMKEHQDHLKKRRDQFDVARTEYVTARSDVAEDLRVITQQLKRIRDQVECQVSDDRRDCLERAWREVKERLDDCGGDGGCCVTDEQCRFAHTLGDDADAPTITAVIKDFERRVVWAEACFDDLVKEPDALRRRVAELKKDVDTLAATASDTKTTDHERVYARLLWMEHRLRQIWLGFDSVNDYVDCLCRALNCSLDGRTALALLIKWLKIIDCKEERRRVQCKWLKENVVEEILAACRRICPPQRDQGSPEQAAS